MAKSIVLKNNCLSFLKKFSSALKEKAIYVLLLTLVWGAILCTINPFNEKKVSAARLAAVEMSDNSCGVAGELVAGASFEQTFVATKNNLRGVSLYMATYARENSGSVLFELFNSDGGAIVRYAVDSSDFIDGSYYNFYFAVEPESKGQQYTIKVTGIDGTTGSSPTIGTTSNSSVDGTEYADINGEKTDKYLRFSALYDQNNLSTICFIWLAMLVIASYVFVFLMDGANEKTFIWYSVLLGAVLIFVNPFVHPIDESTHFFRSFCISQGDFLDDIVDGRIGAYVSSNYGEIVEKNLSIKVLATDASAWMQKFSSEKTFYTNPYMSSVIPINHMVAAVGILIGRLLRLNALGVILLGRIATYLYYTILSYFAIKNVRHYKSILFVAAANPMSFWLAASYSADPILIANTLLFISICFKYIFDVDDTMTIRTWEIVLLMYCGASIASVKYCVYTPILLLFFFIPKEKFGGKKHAITVALAVTVVLVMLVWQMRLLSMFPYKEDRNGHVDVAEQANYMLLHKKDTLRNFYDYFANTLRNHLESFHYFSATSSLSGLVSILTVAIAVIAPDKYEFSDNKRRKLFGISLFIVVVTFLLTMVALYLAFTPVGSYGIDGLQTRYVVPLVPIIMFMLSTVKAECKSATMSKTMVFVAALGMIMETAGNLLTRTFGM